MFYLSVFLVAPEIATPLVSHQDAFYAVGQEGCIHHGRQLSIDAVIVAGSPMPTLTWTLADSTELAVNETSGRARVLANGTLVVANVKDRDDGIYVATAKNEHGKDMKMSKITVV